MNIYIGNIDYDVNDTILQTMFEKFGEVSKASIIFDQNTDRSKGFGFVEMPNKSEAEEAISSLNNSEINGRTLMVNEARPRESRPSRGGYSHTKGY